MTSPNLPDDSRQEEPKAPSHAPETQSRKDAPTPPREQGDDTPLGGAPAPQGRPPRGMSPHPPMSRWQYIFWLVLLVLIPLFGYSQMRDKGRVLELTQSEFEGILQRRTVTTLTVSESAGTGVLTVKGRFQEGEGQKEEKEFVTKVIYSDTLDSMIREYCPLYEAKSEGSTFTQVLFMLLPTVLLIAFFYFIFTRQMRGAGGAMDFGKSRARRLEPGEGGPVTFRDVAGCDEAKEEMQEIVEYLKDPQAFGRLGGRIPRGVLLVGAPGTGKTLLAKAIAGEAGVPFYSISGSDFVEMFVGVGASRVRSMFADAKKDAPCLIFIDEIDAVGRSRFHGMGGGNDEREQTLNALLVEMDGFQSNQGIIVIAATNRPDVLDHALLRPGRFDRQITVDLPDLRGRIAILKVHARKTRLAEDVDLRIIARGTSGFSGAELENLVNEAALLATRAKREAVTMPDLEEARDKVRWGRERRSHKMDAKCRRLTAYHEAGHALVILCCPEAMPLHKITIVPRGNAMGLTMTLPKDDELDRSKRQFLDMIAVCFGGRAAEELTMEDISAGASMDIQQATDIARKMVCQWGMSDRLGPIHYAVQENAVTKGFSPETEREIDLEIRRIVDEQKSRATQILTQHRVELEKLAGELLEKETLSAQEVYELLGWPIPQDAQEAPEEGTEEEPPEVAAVRKALKNTPQEGDTPQEEPKA